MYLAAHLTRQGLSAVIAERCDDLKAEFRESAAHRVPLDVNLPWLAVGQTQAGRTVRRMTVFFIPLERTNSKPASSYMVRVPL